MAGWTTFFSLSADPLPLSPSPLEKWWENGELWTANHNNKTPICLSQFSLEMVKLFAILIHGDESDYAVNGPRNKKMRFPSRWFIVPIIQQDMSLIAK